MFPAIIRDGSTLLVAVKVRRDDHEPLRWSDPRVIRASTALIERAKTLGPSTAPTITPEWRAVAVTFESPAAAASMIGRVRDLTRQALQSR